METHYCKTETLQHLRIGLVASSALLIFITFIFVLFGVLPDRAQAAGPPYTISDPGGGDCSQIGSWAAGSKTCTLNQNISVSGNTGIIIGSNGVTVDGNGYTIANNDMTNSGVFMDGKSSVTVKNLIVTGFYEGIEIYNSSTGATVTANTLNGNRYGIFLFYLSAGNTISQNVITNNTQNGIRVTQSMNNIIDSNVISNNSSYGLHMGNNSDNNLVYNNDFINSMQVYVAGSTGNIFNQPAPVGGNYWSNHATAAQGCVNADNDRFCDAAFSPFAGVTDNLPLARRGYYFTWYDQVSSGAKNWVLMSNPSMTAGEYGWFDLSIAGVAKTLPASTPGLLPGQVGPTGFGLASSITPSFPGVMDGPVDVGYHARSKQIVSQRTLWGDSLEEVTGTDAASLSDHYYWTWYDMVSPGFKNWVLVANPSASEPVTASISFTDVLTGTPVNDTHDIAPGGRWTPTYSGKMGGPVEVKAWLQSGSWPADARDVIASQRVLTNGDTAFNEVPGIPAGELSYRYVWTWYDQQSAGAQDWILIANPPDSGFNMDISIFIHGQGYPGGIDLAPGHSTAVQIAGVMNGPVEVVTVQHNSGIPLNAIVSQRSIWGPSFEEVPGMPYSTLSSLYFWTWYDQVSPNVTNWVQVANPDSGASLFYAISIGGQDPGGACSSGTVAANSVVSCTFPGTMNGPVRVQAWTDASRTALMPVLTSQRVLWKGYFNEVMGTVAS
ncbi:MAG: NosD domain-containing protein [Thermoleophilia bacterium]